MSRQTTVLQCCPLNCLPGKTSACIISSCACYLLLPSASAHNAPLPAAPHAEQFYCFHKFCMIHISSSLSPSRSDTLSLSTLLHFRFFWPSMKTLSHADSVILRNTAQVKGYCWVLRTFCHELKGFIIFCRFSVVQCLCLMRLHETYSVLLPFLQQQKSNMNRYMKTLKE